MMTWSARLEAEYWRREALVVWRAAKWPLLAAIAITVPLANLGYAMPAAICAAVLGMVLGIRRLVAWGDLVKWKQRVWRKNTVRRIEEQWLSVVVATRLAAQGLDGRPLYLGHGRPYWEGWNCVVPLNVPHGIGRDDIVLRADRLAEAFRAVAVTVVGDRAPRLWLRLEYVDALANPFCLLFGNAWDGRSVELGRTSDGQPWRLRIGPHTLVAGSSGSGKASIVWGLLLGLAQPIRSGLVEVWGIDRKGGMELAFGSAMLTRFAADAERSVVLLEDAVAAMQSRARLLAGTTRQHVASVGSPTVVVLIDELAALTAYETDREMLRRANVAIATIASQGRAVGFIVFACLQDPRKETLPARGLFTQTVGLRLRDRIETAMVLGDGAVTAGALCHEISPDAPGTGYVVAEKGAPLRVRSGHVTDEMIRDCARSYPARRQQPVTVPEPVATTTTPRPRSPRTSRAASSRTSKEKEPTS